MQALKNQLAKDMKKISTKLVGLKKAVRKMSLKSWLMLGGFAFVSVGLLIAMVVSRQSSENRSDASEEGLQYYFTPASAVLTQNTAGVLQPVQNVELKINAGRPVVSYSFVMRLTDASGTPVPDSVWQQVKFQPNGKVKAFSSHLLSATYPGAKLFAGTIGQQPDGVTRIEHTITNGFLGAFTFTPRESQPDLRLSMFLIDRIKPEANSVYQLGRLLNPPAADGEEVITLPNQFNLHNPFLVVGSPTPTPIAAVVSRATLQYAVSNGAEWRQLDARFNDFANGGTVKSLIRVQDVDPSWRVEGLSPAFRLRIKNAQGVYKQTTIGGQSTNVLVNFTPNGTLSGGTFWVNWKVIEEGGVKYIQKPNTATPERLRFDSGDTIEVTINLHRVQNQINYSCKENNQLVVAPNGRPEEQQVMGPCVNDSLVTVTYGAGLAPGTCQCDLGVVMDSACGTGTVATCISQPDCACLPDTATATPTLTPTPTVTSTPSGCPLAQIPGSQWIGPGNSSATCLDTGITFTWKDLYLNELEWRIYSVSSDGKVGALLGIVPASNTTTKSFTYNPTEFTPTTKYQIKIRPIYRYQSGSECYQEAQIGKLCQ